MAKKYNFGSIVAMVLGIIAIIAMGGFFVNGLTLDLPILNYLPEVIHTIVGWVLIIGGLLSGILSIVNK